MPSPPPSLFIDRETGSPDVDQILTEAVPIAKLIGLFVSIALVPLAVVFLLGGGSIFGVLFMFFAQFVLAVGFSIVLLYVISRAIELAGE